jgi:polyisoprenoid-binding protein YceI
MKIYKSIILLFFLAVSSVFAEKTTWDTDKSHSEIKFEVTHMVISTVTGYFEDFDISVTSNGNDFTKANIEFQADIKSVNTSNKKRDGHLMSDDFFNAEKYPKMKFKSKKLKKISKNKYKMTGDLTIRNKTKSVELDVVLNGMVKDPWGNERAGFKITGSVDRFDYDLKWNKMIEAGGLVVSKNVDIICNVEIIKQKQKDKS